MANIGLQTLVQRIFDVFALQRQTYDIF